jgi:hypothetical protein
VAAPCAPWHCVRGPVRKRRSARPLNTIVRLRALKRKRLAIVVLAAVIGGWLTAAALQDRRQRRLFDSIRDGDSRADVMAKLGAPDLVEALSPTGAHRAINGCPVQTFYRPRLRILDEEYFVCFNERGEVKDKAYLVSQ